MCILTKLASYWWVVQSTLRETRNFLTSTAALKLAVGHKSSKKSVFANWLPKTFIHLLLYTTLQLFCVIGPSTRRKIFKFCSYGMWSPKCNRKLKWLWLHSFLHSIIDFQRSMPLCLSFGYRAKLVTIFMIMCSYLENIFYGPTDRLFNPQLW